ncbi:MAG: 50S ribosomal protein L11 methyltransferase [Saccharofermentanales bacterium]
MKWIEIEVRTNSEACDAISEKLVILGAYGITVEDPGEIALIINAADSLVYADEGYLASLGTTAVIKAYFAELPEGISLGIKDDENRDFFATDVLYAMNWAGTASLDEFLGYVRSDIAEVGKFLQTGPAEIRWKYVADEDWAHSWKKYYSPFKISDRAVITPSWVAYQAKEGETVIQLDPGSAFGTGNHATTSMCAEMLDAEMARRHDPVDVLDLGCGSGILSVIAAKLGAAHVDAVDIDPVAVKVAEDNCVINGVLDRVTPLRGELGSLRGRQYDIFVANIIADVIQAIAADVPAFLKKGGVFMASGIINTKRDAVLAACLEAGMKPVTEKVDADWVAFQFRM